MVRDCLTPANPTTKQKSFHKSKVTIENTEVALVYTSDLSHGTMGHPSSTPEHIHELDPDGDILLVVYGSTSTTKHGDQGLQGEEGNA